MVTINGRKIGRKYKPYIIAELSANHNGKIETAFESIKIAKKMSYHLMILVKIIKKQLSSTLL